VCASEKEGRRDLIEVTEQEDPMNSKMVSGTDRKEQRKMSNWCGRLIREGATQGR